MVAKLEKYSPFKYEKNEKKTTYQYEYVVLIRHINFVQPYFYQPYSRFKAGIELSQLFHAKQNQHLDRNLPGPSSFRTLPLGECRTKLRSLHKTPAVPTGILLWEGGKTITVLSAQRCHCTWLRYHDHVCLIAPRQGTDYLNHCRLRRRCGIGSGVS